MNEDGERNAVRRRLAVSLGLGAIVLLGIAIALSGGGGHGRRPVATKPNTPTGPISPPPPPTSPPPLLGVSVNRLFLDRTYSPAKIDAQLSALERTGATDARCDALWEAAEPVAPVGGVHHYDWTFADSIAGALARHRLRWLPIIDYTAAWAQSIPGQDHSPPRDPASYAAYAGAFAARYGPGGSFWAEHPAIPARPVTSFEIWNEPDGGHFWLPASDPPAYAALYAAAHTAIKAADPAGRVLIGGVTNPPVFLPAIIAARPDLRGQIDGVAVHPYGPSPPAIVAAIRTDRTVLRSLSLASVPLYVTEFGWTPRPRGAQDWLPARLRPGYIAETITALAHTNCNVGGIFLYTWVTPQHDPANGFDWFGIHPPGGGHTEAEAGFAAGIRAAKQARPPLNVC
jgi:hypothetical protein